MRRLIWIAVKWLAGVAVLAAILYFNWPKFEEMVAQGGRFRLWPLLVAAVCFFTAELVTFLRWFVLVRAQELPFGLADAFRLGLLGQFFNSFLPGSVGGDLVKAGFLAQEQSRRTVAISTIVVDRVLGLLGLMFLAGIAGLVFWDQPNTGGAALGWLVVFAWGVCVAASVMAALLFWILPYTKWLSERVVRLPWVGGVLAELLAAARSYRDKATALAMAMLLAMLGHVGFVMSYCFASWAVPPPVPSLRQQWLLVPVGMVAESVPVTPGNLGVGEFLFGRLYRMAGPDADLEARGALARLAQRLVAWCIACLGLVLYLPLRVRQHRQANGRSLPPVPALAAPDVARVPGAADEAVP
jgi:uncharacterized protein (TIRG00374 family)